MFEMYKKQFFMRPIIKNVLKKADVVFAVSNALKDEILATEVPGIENKTRLYWNSVDIAKFNNDGNTLFKSDFKNKKPVVLFVGNIIKRKNVNSLLEAKKIAKSDYNLVVVGDGPLLKQLKDKAEKENISDVYFTGARKDVEKIIPSADVLVLPSFSESFGLVLIEALASGKPVIGSDVGGIKEIITSDVGLLIDPNSPETIADAVDKIILNDEFRSNLASNARNRAKIFSKVEIPYDEVK